MLPMPNVLPMDRLPEAHSTGRPLTTAAVRRPPRPGRQTLAAEAVHATEALAALIADNAQAHTRAGHWRMPIFPFEGEPFSGQDRVDLLWRLRQRGLIPRAAAVSH